MTKFDIVIEQDYSVKTGLVKMAKNVAVMFGLPALLYVVDNAVNIVPKEYWAIVLPITGAVSYFIKNYITNKNK